MIRYNNQDIVGLRRWNGTAWEDIKNVRKWNGTAWEDVELMDGVLYETGMDMGQSKYEWFIIQNFSSVADFNKNAIGYYWTSRGIRLSDTFASKKQWLVMKYLPIHDYNYLNIEIEKSLDTGEVASARVVLKAEIPDGTYMEFAEESLLFDINKREHHLCIDLRTARENMMAMRLERLKTIFGVSYGARTGFLGACSIIKKIRLSK